MRHTRPLLALILAATMPLGAIGAGTVQSKKSSSTLTVGDFAVMLAATAAKTPGLQPKAATEALVKRGVPLGDPAAPLSEAKLAQILDFYGVHVKTSSPDQTVTSIRAANALGLISGSISNGISTMATPGVPNPATLDDCLALANHGQCVNCCKDLLGTATTCSKACMEINKGSATEPLP